MLSGKAVLTSLCCQLHILISFLFTPIPQRKGNSSTADDSGSQLKAYGKMILTAPSLCRPPSNSAASNTCSDQYHCFTQFPPCKPTILQQPPPSHGTWRPGASTSGTFNSINPSSAFRVSQQAGAALSAPQPRTASRAATWSLFV